jgi:hypothetical protein
VLDAFGRAEDLEAVVGLAEHGGVEGAAAEVEDRDHLTALHFGGGRVGNGRRFGLGERQRAFRVEARELHGLGDELPLERSPVGREGHGDDVRRRTLAFGDGGHDRSQQAGHQRLG